MCHLSPTETVIAIAAHAFSIVFCVLVWAPGDDGLAPLSLHLLAVLHQHFELDFLRVSHEIKRNEVTVDDLITVLVHRLKQIKL